MIRVISYNIRYNTPADGENAWPHRKNRVVGLLNKYQPDLIGLQEVRKEMLDELIPMLPDFDWVGVGRDDGKSAGEFAAIFYRKDRLRMIESGNIWLSETPEVVGSVGWDASMARIASWAIFVDRLDESQIRHVNTHFDHRGEVAQVESARLLRTFLAEVAVDIPTIITGDFNCNETSAPYQNLTEDGEATRPLINAQTVSETPHEGPNKTFNGTFTEPLQERIDYIFIRDVEATEQNATTHGSIHVLRHAVLTDNEDGRYPSDHLPVLADIRLGE